MSFSREKYSSLVIPAVLKLFLITNAGTSFLTGITTGLKTPFFRIYEMVSFNSYTLKSCLFKDLS